MANLIFGCGYVGFRVAQKWLDRGQRVYALTRSKARAETFQKQGIVPVIGDVTQPLTFAALERIDTVLYAVGFDRTSPYSIEEIYVSGFARALAALPGDIERLIYVSSTGVYGQSNGEWVDEDSPCQPQREGGKAVLAAEQLLAGDTRAARSIVLRLAGIYGPGRVPKLHDVEQGKPIAGDGESFLNLIHVDDVVSSILAAEKAMQLPDRYVISDGCPVRRVDFYTELARQLGMQPPVFVDPQGGAANNQRGLSSKRIRNTRMVTELISSLRYPSYREGLADVIRSDGQ